MGDPKTVDQATQPASGSPSPAGPDLTGRTLGDFQILRCLGQGGMGQVYLAQQLSLKRKVALKIMRADLAANATALKRFKAEAEAVARITHANIVQVYFIGECDALHYMALEYVDGRNLRDYLLRKGPPDVLLALSIMRQVAAALQRASELGIVHRDIKPENILLNRKGEVKVADFGLSRCFAGDQQPLNLTQSGVTMGTPLYMSPEQVQGKEIDPRTDIYSFGITCYHMLAGHPPFRGQTAFEVAMMQVQNEPAPLTEIRPDLPAELALIVHKMMAKNPADRYQTGRELLKDLTRLREALNGDVAAPHSQPVPLSISGSGVLAPGTGSSPSRLPLTATLPGQRRRWLPWLVALTILLALAGGAGVKLLQRRAATALPGDPPTGSPTAIDPETLREQQLRDRVAEPFDAAEPRQVRSALDGRVDLGLFYLHRRRLPKADEFFQGLSAATNPPAFRTLGQLGHGMVLAFDDKPQQSNKVLLEVLHKHPFRPQQAGNDSYLLLVYPELWETLDQALDYNARNGDLPPSLQRLRWMPGKRPGPFGEPKKAMRPKEGEKPPEKKEG
jgi:serine/threonine-protein kinase